MARNKKENVGNTDKNRKRRNPIIPILIMVILYAVIVLAYTFISTHGISPQGLILTMKNKFTYIIYIILLGAVGIYTLVNWRLSEKRAVMKENELSDSRWLSDKDIKRATRTFYETDFKGLATSNDGIPFRGIVRKRSEDYVILKKPIHGGVLGTTGTGKTTGYIDPMIQIMGQFKTKPCLIISDPKGELYRHHREYLTKKGYTVVKIDYRHPYQSMKVNPFQPIIDRIIELKNQIVCEKGKYTVDGKTYQTYGEAEKAASERRQILEDEIYENMEDMVYTLFPIKNEKEPSWEQGARNLIFGICLLFVDDILAGKMRIEQLCLLNIYQTLARYCSEDMTVLKAYFEEHKENVKAYGLAKGVLLTSDRTLTSYLSQVMNYISFLADGGLQCITAGNDIGFKDFDSKPNAIFLVFPDEKDGRQVMVSLFIVQTYKSLVYLADMNKKNNLTQDAELRRNCYFFLDEFGQLPKIHKFGTVTSVARSRHIFFLCVFQSYSQLEKVYGKEEGQTIKDQLQIKIFLGTDDKNSVEEFSWLCGKKKTYSFSADVGLGKDANDTYSAKEKPLITTEELMLLNNEEDRGNAIISSFGQRPMRTYFTPAYNARRVYEIGDSEGEEREAEIFDWEPFFYDIGSEAIAENAFEEAEISDEEIAEMEELRREEEKQVEAKIAVEAKINGLISSIETKLGFLYEYLPAEVIEKISTDNPENSIKCIDDFMIGYDGVNSVRYELCYIKTLFQRLAEARKEYISRNAETM